MVAVDDDDGDDDHHAATKHLANAKRRERRLRDRVAKLSAELKATQAQLALYTIPTTPPAEVNNARGILTLRSGLLLAIRRNCGHSSQTSAIAWTEFERAFSITRHTVSRWEIKLSTCIMAGLVASHTCGGALMRAARKGLRIALHCFRGDATISQTWHGNELQLLHLASVYEDIEGTEPRQQCSGWLDTQVVEGGTSADCFRMVEKQLRCGGCPALDKLYGALGPERLRWVHVAGDDGPDQQGMRSTVLELHRADGSVTVTSAKCSLHQQSLIVKSRLSLLELLSAKWDQPGACFSCVAKLSNLCRLKPKDFGQ